MTFGVSPCFGQEEEPNQQRGEEFGTLYMVMMTTMLTLLLISCWLGRATAPRANKPAKVVATQASVPCSGCGQATGSSAAAALTSSDVVRRPLTCGVFTTPHGERAHVSRHCSAVRHARDLKEWPLCRLCGRETEEAVSETPGTGAGACVSGAHVAKPRGSARGARAVDEAHRHPPSHR